MENTGHTLEELRERVEKNLDSQRAKQKTRYHLAKELGFSPAESAVLQNWSEADIRKLAKERAVKCQEG